MSPGNPERGEIGVAVQTGYPHILLDEKGTPIIEGTSLKVIELVVEKQAYGWSPEELWLQHPYLGLAEIHAALAYYWDHAQDLDREITERLEHTESLRQTATASQAPLKARLRAKGLI